MCRVSLDIVALALFTSYGGVVYEPRGIRISRCVFKYCCGVEVPSILRKFAPLYLLSPRYTPVYQWRIPHPPPPYQRVRMTARLPLISRSGSGIVYSGADLGGRCRGCAPPPDDLRFSNTTCILQKKTMWFIGVEVEQETSAPPPKKILDPPLILAKGDTLLG